MLVVNHVKLVNNQNPELSNGALLDSTIDQGVRLCILISNIAREFSNVSVSEA